MTRWRRQTNPCSAATTGLNDRPTPRRRLAKKGMSSSKAGEMQLLAHSAAGKVGAVAKPSDVGPAPVMVGQPGDRRHDPRPS